MKFLIGIPAYNEGPNLKPLLTKCLLLSESIKSNNLKLHVCVVDDCSTDNTSEEVVKFKKNNFSNLDLELIKHESNKGLSGSVETLWNWASHFRTDEIVGLGLLDGDNSHDPNNFSTMLELLNQNFDVIICSRYVSGSKISGLSLYRKFLSKMMSLIFISLGRIPGVRDYSCGFRLYKSSLIKKIPNLCFKYRSFACMVELLKRCHLNGAICTEVPFELRYDLKLGASKMNFSRTIKETLKVLFDNSL
jgi:dolichol-phosphate mannosyltransferase